MIIFFYGTTAEAIKIAPIARRLANSGVEYQQWVTYQHAGELQGILGELGLQKPNVEIVNGIDGKPVKTVFDTFRWLWRIYRWYRRNRKQLMITTPPNSVILVHGDTITTVIGALVAKGLRVPCAHVEAGLRSGSWRHPFPEEIDRLLVGRLAQIHFAPDQKSAENLGNRANVVFTHGNTVIDAVLDHARPKTEEKKVFGILLLHRFEFLKDQVLIARTLSEIVKNAPVPVHFFADEYGQSLLGTFLEDKPRSKLILQPRLSHFEFTRQLTSASFVITDSGGIQEEAALLGVPTLIHRKATERGDGLGENVMLSEWDMDRVEWFLQNYTQLRRPVKDISYSPSQVIIDELASRGFISVNGTQESG